MSTIFGGGKNNSDINAPTFEGYSCEANGDLLAIQESYDDYSAIMEAIYKLDNEEINLKKEIKTLAENGTAVDDERMLAYFQVTENLAKDVWTKMTDFFKKLWGKLQAFFNSVVRFFDSLFKSGKDFATKYEKQLEKLVSDGKLSGYKVKMYKYDDAELKANKKASDGLGMVEDELKANDCTTDFISGTVKSGEAIRTKIDEINSDKEYILNKVRAKFVGEGVANREEYLKKLHEKFRGGSEQEEEAVDVKSMISVLKTEDSSKAAKDAIKDLNNVFKKRIDEIRKFENQFKGFVNDGKTPGEDMGKLVAAGKSSEAYYKACVAFIEKTVSMFSSSKDIALDYFREWKNAVSERNNVYKSALAGAFRYKASK